MSKQTWPLKTATKDKNKNTELAKRLALLKVEIQNSDTVGENLEEYNRNRFLEIAPPASNPKASTEKASEEIVARDNTLEILKKILKPTVVSNVLEYLQKNDQIGLFNRFKTLFLKLIHGQDNLSFDEFLNVWTKFSKEILKKSNDTGIIIQQNALMNEAGITDPALLIEYKNKIENTLRRIQKFFGINNQGIEDAFIKSYEETEKKSIKIGDKIKVPVVDDDGNYVLKSYTFNKPVIKKLKTPKIGTKWNFLELTEKDHPGSVEDRNKIKFAYMAKNIVKEEGLIQGGSIKTLSQQVKIIEKKEKSEKPIQVGNYYISQKSLHNNYLVYTYKSGIKLLKKTLISNDLKKLFLFLIENNKINSGMYNKLDTDEQKIFDNFLQKTQSSSLLQQHTKFDDKDRNELIKRFNLLKGQLLAGNDAHEIINELSSVLLNLQEKKIMSEKDANKIFKKILLLKK